MTTQIPAHQETKHPLFYLPNQYSFTQTFNHPAPAAILLIRQQTLPRSFSFRGLLFIVQMWSNAGSIWGLNLLTTKDHNDKSSITNEIVKTQRNSTQLKVTLKQLALELDIVATCSPPHHPTHTNFSATSRPARKLKFGTDTH